MCNFYKIGNKTFGFLFGLLTSTIFFLTVIEKFVK